MISEQEFRQRHDFNTSEVDVLKSKYPRIIFSDIPEAWIIILDDMLSKIGESIRGVSQIGGYLVLDCGFLCNEDESIADAAERLLYEADIDLHVETSQAHSSVLN